MEPEKIKEAFEKFYKESPFVGMGDRYKIAMEGAYLAGSSLVVEELKKHIK